MSKCTAAQAVTAMEYWLGYYEKASADYAQTRDKSAFARNKGSNNYTYAGYLCGVQGGAWCAMQVSTAVREACGDSTSDAKAVLHGVWPYTACNQLYDAAPSASKGRRGSWTPRAGDVIVFSDDGSTRTHTGLVYAADSTYVYTIEGNSSNQCRRRSYLLTSTYIYGYVRPAYAAATEKEGSTMAETTTAEATTTTTAAAQRYGEEVYADIGLHELSKGCAGPEVKTLQRILYARGIDRTIDADGDFGKQTRAATQKLQAELGLTQDGVVGKDTWKAMLTAMD